MLKSLSWLVGGRMLNAVVSIITTAVLARLLSPADFGVVAALMAVLAVSNVIFDGAFGLNLVRKHHVSDLDIRTTLTIAVSTAFVLSLILIMLASQIEHVFGFAGLSLMLLVSSVIIPARAVYAIAGSVLQRERRFQVLATGSVVGQIAGYLVVGVTLALLNFGPWSLIAALIVAGVVEAGFLAQQSKIPLRPAWKPDVVREIGSTSMFSAANLMNWLANTSPNMIIGSQIGATELGIYSRGWKLLDLIVAGIATPTSRVLVPVFAASRGDTTSLREYLTNAFHIAVPGYLMLSVLLTCHAEIIVYIALGEQWQQTIPIAQIFFITLLPRAAFKISEAFAVATGKAQSAFLRQGIYACLTIGGAFLGSLGGVINVAVNVSIAIAIFYFLSISFALKLAGGGRWGIIAVHIKGIIFAGIVASLDQGLQYLLDDYSLFARHGISGVVTAICAFSLLFATPFWWMGRYGVSLREKIRKRL